MHPAYSVLFFTTVSGAGYGLLLLLGLTAALGLAPQDRWFGLAGLVLALGLVTAGLLSSTLHLRHPERAWRALSQWRSSWLSREGVAAVATYAPAGLLGLGWVILDRTDGIWALFGALAGIGAAVTVFCTGMIYASLKPIRQWHHPLVAPVYLLFALATGALWHHAVLRAFAEPAADGSAWVACLCLALAWGAKAMYWRQIDDSQSPSGLVSATGLTAFETVRLLDAPHTEENYLQSEMVYRVGRKHAAKLRRLALVTGAAGPIIACLLAVALPGALGAALAVVAVLAGMLGAFIERWLFFAQAKHTVSLYYGQSA